MSANRSVQAAQRRRAGPTNSEPNIPGRGPQTSINSAQLFSNQSRPGSGSAMPIGRLAGQQAAMQQQSYQQGQQNDKLSSVSKMTIPQAITLITLRLGAVESKIMNMPEGGNSIIIDGESGIDSGILESIMSRLESLEKRSSSNTSSFSSTEFNLLKQQYETIKQAVLQTKNSTTTIIKENVTLKTQVDNLRNELTETKELLVALQNLTMDNSQKILDLSLGEPIDYNGELNETNITAFDELQNGELTNLQELSVGDDSEQNEIVGTNLKQLIESELNLEGM